MVWIDDRSAIIVKFLLFYNVRLETAGLQKLICKELCPDFLIAGVLEYTVMTQWSVWRVDDAITRKANHRKILCRNFWKGIQAGMEGDSYEAEENICLLRVSRRAPVWNILLGVRLK
jgi:hypothetical protein